MENTKKVVVLGKFDGVHIGHRALIKEAIRLASENNTKVTVYVISPKMNMAITSDFVKKQILESLGADEVVFRLLDDNIRNMSAEEFFTKVVIDELNAGYVVVGKNFRFAKDRSADSMCLRSLGTQYEVGVSIVDSVCMLSFEGKSEEVSSTAIRKYIADGRVDWASKYLGRDYTIKGTVTDGKHLGRKLGFPTVNVYPQSTALTMKNGVYVTLSRIDDKLFWSITNVGTNPTVDDRTDIITETHLLDADIDCYGKEIEISFLEFIRSEQCFENTDELKKQINNDISYALQYRDIKIKEGEGQ